MSNAKKSEMHNINENKQNNVYLRNLSFGEMRVPYQVYSKYTIIFDIQMYYGISKSLLMNLKILTDIKMF